LHKDSAQETDGIDALGSDLRLAHFRSPDVAVASAVLTFQHGEIFISVELARRHARSFGNSLMRELQLYIVHGLLHLHGFDDRTQREAREMKRAQEKILRRTLSC
jgi:probable rRNA maturation factor